MAPEVELSCYQPHSVEWHNSRICRLSSALFSCQVGQWSGKVTAVNSALSTEERASG
jgi:hypothetical protein